MVEHGAEVPPHGERVSSLAFIVKSVHTGDRVAFMVSPQQEDHIWVTHLICEQQTHSLYTLLTSIHEVTYQKELVVRRATTANTEESE